MDRERIAVDVFRRKELKFLLNDDQCSVIRDALQRKMEPDAHGENTICNIYYVTPDYRLIRHSLEHPVYKEKIRLRPAESPEDIARRQQLEALLR